MGIGVATSGLLIFETPETGPLYVAPRFVDQATGVWQAVKEEKPFSQASGRTVKSTAVYSWEEGARAEAEFSAAIERNKVRAALQWKLEGDAQGHIRADLLIPYDLASRIQIEDSDGKVIYADGSSAPFTGGAPLAVTDKSSGKRLFSIEGDVTSAAVRVDSNFERNGIEVRLSPYRRGGKNSLSETDRLEFEIVF